MIPLRDDNPTTKKTWVTWALIVITTLVWLVLQPHRGSSVVDVSRRTNVDFGRTPAAKDLQFSLSWAAIPCEVSQQRALTVGEVDATFGRGSNASACGEPEQSILAAAAAVPQKSVSLSVLASIFLHGGLLHLAGNMLYLFIFGNNIEDRWGRVRFIIFYLAGGIVATLAHVFADRDSTIPVVGASGAIAAVMGAYLVLYPKARITAIMPIFVVGMMTKLPAWGILAVWFVSQFFIAPNAGVAWVAHVGGFVFGALVALGATAGTRLTRTATAQ